MYCQKVCRFRTSENFMNFNFKTKRKIASNFVAFSEYLYELYESFDLIKFLMMEDNSWNRRSLIDFHMQLQNWKWIWLHCVRATEKYIVLMLRQISQSCGKNSFVLVACQNITAQWKNSWNYCARDCDNRTTLVKQKFQPNSFPMYAM